MFAHSGFGKALTAMVCGACVVGSAACGGAVQNPAATASSADYDKPVAESVARATAGYTVDLEAHADCEQRFDLQLYRDKRVDLIRWDDEDGCHARAIDVRFLSASLAEPALFELIRKFVRSVERRPKR